MTMMACPPISPAESARALLSVQPRLDLSDQNLLAAYWRFHPRFRFFKTVVPNAQVPDIGAGAGGLAQWKSWLEPVRTDIRVFAVDQARPSPDHRYERWETVDLDHALPRFPGLTFDAAILSHVVEHLSAPTRLLSWLAARLRPGSPIYIEWPSLASAEQPNREALLPYGVDLVISNFFDDATHRRLISPDALRDALLTAGFSIRVSGTIDLGLIGEEMLARGLRHDDPFSRLAGFWSVTGWANWVEAVTVQA